jgi:hypothetical protein
MNKLEAIKMAQEVLRKCSNVSDPDTMIAYNTRATAYATLALSLEDKASEAPSSPGRKFIGNAAQSEYNEGYDQGLYDGAFDLAKTILYNLDDNYKAPELKTQLIRESCQYAMGQK